MQARSGTDRQLAASKAELLQAFVDRVASDSGTPHISVALSVTGSTTVVQSGSSNAPDRHSAPEQLYAIGCISKGLTAAVVLELCREHVIELEAPIGNYLEELSDCWKGQNIRISDLLSHSCGYFGMQLFNEQLLRFSWNDLVDEVRTAEQLFRPGSVCSYDQSATALLGKIVERITGQPSPKVVRELILAPLMRKCAATDAIPNARWNDDNDHDLWEPSSSNMRLSILELLSIAELLCERYEDGTGSLVSAFTLSRLHTTVVETPQIVGEWYSHTVPTGYGMGLAQYQNNVRGLCGRGIYRRSSVRIHRPLGIAMAVGIQAGPEFLRDTVIDSILSEFGLPGRARSSSVLTLAPEELEGTYLGFRGFAVAVSVSGTSITIVLRQDSRRAARIHASIDDDGAFSVSGSEKLPGVTFFRDPTDGTPCLMLGVYALRRTS